MADALMAYAGVELSGVDSEDGQMVEALFLAAYGDLIEPPLRSPRKRYRQEDFDFPQSFWQRIRERRSEEACLKFCGLPLYMLEELAKLALPHLSMYDKSVTRRGKPTALDYIDVVAVALRYTQLVDKKYMEHLCMSFGRNDAVIGRAVKQGMEALLLVLRELPDAGLRYPTLEEAKKQWAGMKQQLGVPAWEGFSSSDIMLILFSDGTFTKALRASNLAESKRQKGAKGAGWNTVLTFAGDGCIVDAVWVVLASYNDDRVSKPILRRHWDPAHNPHRYGMILDNGWRAHSAFSDGGPGKPPMRVRPLKEGDAVPHGLLPLAMKMSRSVTVYRQLNEMG